MKEITLGPLGYIKLMVFMMSAVIGGMRCQEGGSEDQAGAAITTRTLAMGSISWQLKEL